MEQRTSLNGSENSFTAKSLLKGEYNIEMTHKDFSAFSSPTGYAGGNLGAQGPSHFSSKSINSSKLTLLTERVCIWVPLFAFIPVFVCYHLFALLPPGDVAMSIRKGLGGGVGGAVGGVIQVLTMMWLRTAMNYQYRNGGTLGDTLRLLHSEGGIGRLYQGVGFALLQAPLSRFGNTFANVAVLAMFSCFAPNVDISTQTMVATAAASLWRLAFTPLDMFKTTLQVEGASAYGLLLRKVEELGPAVLWTGALGNAVASFVGSYPWFLTFNLLDSRLPPSNLVVRAAIMGLVSTCLSDALSNSIRVIKTVKQTAKRDISYREALATVLQKDGLAGVFCRGLGTRLLTNAIQSMLFSVVWKTVEALMNVGLPESQSIPTILVVGGGPSALATLRSLSMLPTGSVDFKAYDRQLEPGGMWTGNREFSPMYDGMWLNGHHMYNEFGSYTYDDHFGRVTVALHPRSATMDYLRGYLEENDLAKHITPSTDVTGVSWDAKINKFVVKSRSIKEEGDSSQLATGPLKIKPYTSLAESDEAKEKTEYFDYVALATGTFNKPNYRPIEGFEGEQLHAREWIGPREYSGKKVVVVGGGDSGKDFVQLLLKHEASEVIWAVRSFPEEATPETCDIKDVDIHGVIVSAKGRTVTFKDASVNDVDLIVHATGYDHSGSYSFLSRDLQPPKNAYDSTINDHYFIKDLYHDMIPEKHPRLIFTALNSLTASSYEYEIKAEFIASYVSGQVCFPSEHELAIYENAKWGVFDYLHALFFAYEHYRYLYLDRDSTKTRPVNQDHEEKMLQQITDYHLNHKYRDEVAPYLPARREEIKFSGAFAGPPSADYAADVTSVWDFKEDFEGVTLDYESSILQLFWVIVQEWRAMQIEKSLRKPLLSKPREHFANLKDLNEKEMIATNIIFKKVYMANGEYGMGTCKGATFASSFGIYHDMYIWSGTSTSTYANYLTDDYECLFNESMCKQGDLKDIEEFLLPPKYNAVAKDMLREEMSREFELMKFEEVSVGGELRGSRGEG